MSTPKRTITIDTNIQSLSKRGKNKSVKNAAATIRPKLKTNQFIRPSTLKKQLLARIKTHQQKKNTHSDVTTLRDSSSTAYNNNNNTNNNNNNNNNNNTKGVTDSESFSQSLEYLQSLAVNRKDRKQKTKTQRINTNTNTHANANANATVASPQPYLSPQQPQPSPQVLLTAFPSEENTSTAPPIIQNQLLTAAAAAAASAPALQLSLPVAPPPVSQLTQLTSTPVSASPFESYVNNYNENNPPVVLNSEPQWGCLKSGNKPTFRSFHNKTCKVSTTINSEPNNNINSNNSNNSNKNNNSESESVPAVTDTTPVMSDSESESEREGPDPVALSEVLYGSRQQRLNDYRNEQVKIDKKNIEPVIKIKQTKQRIVTKKYKLGKYTNKTGPVIGVLIKNVQTQRNVEKKRNEMKHIPLDTIISRLHKKRLLKVGSSAPPDVLRELYESSALAGDIENEGNDIALHNFLAGSTDNDTTA
jgi:hypothetical protein